MTAQGKGWFGDIISQLVGSAAQGGVQYLGQHMQNQYADKVRDEDRAYAESLNERDWQRKLQLLEMAEGPKGPFLGFTDPQKVAAMQNQQKASADALKTIIAAYQKMLGVPLGR